MYGGTTSAPDGQVDTFVFQALDNGKDRIKDFENGIDKLDLRDFAPEKLLTVRRDWAETEPHLLERLMRAVWMACKWLGRPDSRTAAAEILSRPEYLNMTPEWIDRALSGDLIISGHAEQRHVPRFLEFYAGAATFPWRSQAKWIGDRLAQHSGHAPAEAQAIAASVFRTDLYRSALGPIGADLPGASEKIEGSIRAPLPVASQMGRLTLLPNAFFDGLIFEPKA